MLQFPKQNLQNNPKCGIGPVAALQETSMYFLEIAIFTCNSRCESLKTEDVQIIEPSKSPNFYGFVCQTISTFGSFVQRQKKHSLQL